jgi:hypothetical protein
MTLNGESIKMRKEAVFAYLTVPLEFQWKGLGKPRKDTGSR